MVKSQDFYLYLSSYIICINYTAHTLSTKPLAPAFQLRVAAADDVSPVIRAPPHD